jgi:hypothetical protein
MKIDEQERGDGPEGTTEGKENKRRGLKKRRWGGCVEERMGMGMDVDAEMWMWM